LRNFLGGLRVYVNDAEFTKDLPRHLHSILGQRSRNLCGFVDFLAARGAGVRPVPGDPPEIASLNDQDSGIGDEQMPVFHCAQIE
jgi:hypothetical protein